MAGPASRTGVPRSELYHVAMTVDEAADGMRLYPDFCESVNGAIMRSGPPEVGVSMSVPGLLCFCVTDNRSGETHCHSEIHGAFRTEVERFERDFLPFVLDREETKCVRFLKRGKHTSSVMYWRGGDPEEVVQNVLAEEVMES